MRFSSVARDCHFEGVVVDVEPETGNLFVAVVGYRELFFVDQAGAVLLPREGAMPPELAQLHQCRQPVHDGNLVSKSARDTLDKAGLVARSSGWNIVTDEGLRLLVLLGFLRA